MESVHTRIDHILRHESEYHPALRANWLIVEIIPPVFRLAGNCTGFPSGKCCLQSIKLLIAHGGIFSQPVKEVVGDLLGAGGVINQDTAVRIDHIAVGLAIKRIGVQRREHISVIKAHGKRNIGKAIVDIWLRGHGKHG